MGENEELIRKLSEALEAMLYVFALGPPQHQPHACHVAREAIAAADAALSPNP